MCVQVRARAPMRKRVFVCKCVQVCLARTNGLVSYSFSTSPSTYANTPPQEAPHGNGGRTSPMSTGVSLMTIRFVCAKTPLALTHACARAHVSAHTYTHTNLRPPAPPAPPAPSSKTSLRRQTTQHRYAN